MKTQTLVSKDPSNGEIIGEVSIRHDLPTMIATAQAAQRQWAEKPLTERVNLIQQAYARLQDQEEAHSKDCESTDG